MKRIDKIISTLETLGYHPSLDEDGDVCFLAQMHLIYILDPDGLENGDNYYDLLYFHFWKIDEGEDSSSIISYINAQKKIVKVYADESDPTCISARYQFYCPEDELLNTYLEQAISSLIALRPMWRYLLSIEKASASDEQEDT